MKAGFIQYDVAHGDKKKNIRKVSAMIGECGFFVLPELSFIGYMFDSKEELYSLAENIPDGETTQALLRLSAERNCTIIAGIAENDGGKLFNTAVIVSKGAYIGEYRKIHLSDYEKTFFDRGEDISVFEIEGMSVGVQICFDLWFPEVSREQVLAGANILFALANFGGATTPKIARVRAIENVTPVVLCNRIGHEKTDKIDADFLGNSMIIGQDGESLCTGAHGEEVFSCAQIPFGKKGNVICSDYLEEIRIHY